LWRERGIKVFPVAGGTQHSERCSLAGEKKFYLEKDGEPVLKDGKPVTTHKCPKCWALAEF
jgi:hypothetical protein